MRGSLSLINRVDWLPSYPIARYPFPFSISKQVMTYSPTRILNIIIVLQDPPVVQIAVWSAITRKRRWWVDWAHPKVQPHVGPLNHALCASCSRSLDLLNKD